MRRSLNLSSQWHPALVAEPPSFSSGKSPFLSYACDIFPTSQYSPDVRAWKRTNLRHAWRGLWRIVAARQLRIPTYQGEWRLTLISPRGEQIDYGVVSLRVVTTIGAQYVVNAFRGTATLSNMRYHALGTGGTLESIADTGMNAELSSEYNPTDTRATGTLVYGTDSSGNDVLTTFRTVGVVNLSTSTVVREIGLFSQASRTAGTPVGGYLFDRGVFSDMTILEGYAVQSRYDLSVTAGG